MPDGKSSLSETSPRELVRGFMRGNRAELKLGYSPANAVLAVLRIHPDADEDGCLRGYSQGFSDGMLSRQPMVSPPDPDNAENRGYREGYADGITEPAGRAYPSSQPV